MGRMILPSNIPLAITYLQLIASGEPIIKNRKFREIEALYLQSSPDIGQNLLKLAKAWGDSPAVRQIIYYHYIQKVPLIKELISSYLYPQCKDNLYIWNESLMKSFLVKYSLTTSEQNKVIKYLEQALKEATIFYRENYRSILQFQRPTVEAVCYAFYAEYGDGFPEGRRFRLKNPPFQQIKKHAAFPAYFFLNHHDLQLIFETCRLKNYITLESRGGLYQYVLIYEDLSGLVDFMTGGGT